MPHVIDLSELLEDKKNDIDFTAVVEHDRCSKREIFVGDIYEGMGISIDTLIRFWNDRDEEAGIPAEERTPITMLIDSNGGSLTDGFTICDAIQLSKTPVHTMNIGKAYSAGFFIFLVGHQRFSYPRASFMFHQGSAATGGDANKFESFANFYKEVNMEQIKMLMLENTDYTEEQYEDFKKDDLWLTAGEMMEIGGCEKILGLE